MLGKPQFTTDDVVRFRIADRTLIGTIAVVDEYGTWEDASDVSYDIMVTPENTLYKHIPECLVSRLNEELYYGG
jgi:hypothetical protein